MDVSKAYNKILGLFGIDTLTKEAEDKLSEILDDLDTSSQERLQHLLEEKVLL